jgi:hypothetical protein
MVPLSRLFGAFVRKHVVDAVPDEMAPCFSCKAEECSSDTYETCLDRLTHARRSLLRRSGDGSDYRPRWL